jgi:long-chain acyl-CoA synthetase
LHLQNILKGLFVVLWRSSSIDQITLVTFGFVGAVKKLFEADALRSVPVKDDKAHRVRPGYKGNLIVSPREKCFTLYDLVSESFRSFGSRNCMGSREFLGWKIPKKVKHFGQTKWLSFAEVGEKAYKFGAALRATKLVPAPDTTDLKKVKESSRIAIFENTCQEWMISAIGAFTQSITVATVYATLGMDAVVEAVQDNLILVLVCNKRDVSRVAARKAEMPTLTCIVYTNDLVAPDDIIQLPGSSPELQIISFDDFIASGDVKAFPPTPPQPGTPAVVMYTSGSTGKPKGVMISHSHIVACCAAVDVALSVVPGVDVYLGYLPLAHIMELMAEFMMVAVGCTICYADPKSLTSTGAFPHGALEEFAPTLMVAVPKIWDVIKKGIQAKVAAGSPIVQFLVKTAFQWRNFALKHGFDTPLFKVLVFKKFKAAVGGRLRFGLSGGGPLNEEVQDFVRCAFGIDICQGYVSTGAVFLLCFKSLLSYCMLCSFLMQGLTETCAGLTVQEPSDLRGRIAGAPVASVEIKLESTPEVSDKNGNPYLSSDSVDVEGSPVFGRGEVVVRGNSISAGYYMMEDKTKEEFKEGGWFYTGDIGQFMSDGSLRIVDRKKNLVKLKGGEYIALEKMEMTYGNSSFVDAVNGGICCYGDGDMDRCVALMELSEPYTMKWAKDNSISGDFETIKKSKKLYNAVMADLLAEHSKSDLSHLEKLVAVSLLTEPWTPENGCLTAANKLQRREVVLKFSKEFNDLKPKGIF